MTRATGRSASAEDGRRADEAARSRRRTQERGERSRSQDRRRRSGDRSRKERERDSAGELRLVATAARAGSRRDDNGKGDRPSVQLTARRRSRSRERRSRSHEVRRESGNDHYGAALSSFGSSGGGASKGQLPKGLVKGVGKGKGTGVFGKPPERPGFDRDERLKQLEDDPRYFEGAELGKAELAALGCQGLVGMNTASFYAKDTLVRPSMRVFYGTPQKRLQEQLKSDDMLVVPAFHCEEGELGECERLVHELRSAEDDADLSQLPGCDKLVRKICKYLSIGEDGRGVRLSWHRGSKEPLVRSWGKLRGKLSSSQNCLATVSLGVTQEYSFKRSLTEELLFFPALNGSLALLGRDVCLRWQRGLRAALAPSNKLGHLSVEVAGSSPIVSEDDVLAQSPSDAKPGGLDGCDGEPSIAPRPSMRITVVPPRESYGHPVSHDDVIIVPEFFCKEDDWDIYYQLLKEMRTSQAAGERRAEWVSWHEGAHLLSQNPTGSKTYQKVLDKMSEYFSISPQNKGTRFNWYRDGSDWKPFHHDSAAFNPERAKDQNCTIGISFGAPRELAFRHAKTGELVYFPQKNGMLFYFGKDANIVWQHGINALPEKEQDGKGRVSIILWGLCTTTVDEEGSPPLLDNNTRKGKGKGGKDGPCRDFQLGRCNYGDRCRFSHGQGGGGGGRGPACHAFQQGRCSYGDRCRFSHD